MHAPKHVDVATCTVFAHAVRGGTGAETVILWRLGARRKSIRESRMRLLLESGPPSQQRGRES